MDACDIIDGDQWFLYKASEFAGSYRQWDEIVATILRYLPVMPRELGESVPGEPDGYYLEIVVVPPLVLTYRVEETDDQCVVILVDLRIKQ